MENVKAVRLLRIRYIVGLGLIALLVTGSYLTKQRVIAEQNNFAELINLAGHQSGLAHRIAYFSLEMITTDEADNFFNAKTQVGQTIARMEQVQEINPRHARACAFLAVLAVALVASVLVLPSMLALWDSWHRKRGEAVLDRSTLAEHGFIE